jgi:hypothetical protein
MNILIFFKLKFKIETWIWNDYRTNERIKYRCRRCYLLPQLDIVGHQTLLSNRSRLEDYSRAVASEANRRSVRQLIVANNFSNLREKSFPDAKHQQDLQQLLLKWKWFRWLT